MVKVVINAMMTLCVSYEIKVIGNTECTPRGVRRQRDGLQCTVTGGEPGWSFIKSDV